MALVKGYLMPFEGEPDTDKIKFLFNPTLYTFNQTNTIAEVAIPGLSGPILQYVAGKAKTLKFDLFLDTYEAGTSVKTLTDQIYALMDPDGKKHVPPVVEFGWGEFLFICVLESIDGTFTLFRSDGTPVRATLKVSLKEFLYVDLAVKKVANESTDRVKTWTVKRGDTLSGIASVEYGDPRQWRPIAETNGIDDPLSIRPGDVLVLPALTGSAG